MMQRRLRQHGNADIGRAAAGERGGDQCRALW